MLLYWFMPALAKSSVGSSCGTTLLDGQCVCRWPTKYLRSGERRAMRARDASGAAGALDEGVADLLRGPALRRVRHARHLEARGLLRELVHI